MGEIMDRIATELVKLAKSLISSHVMREEVARSSDGKIKVDYDLSSSGGRTSGTVILWKANSKGVLEIVESKKVSSEKEGEDQFQEYVKKYHLRIREHMPEGY